MNGKTSTGVLVMWSSGQQHPRPLSTLGVLGPASSPWNQRLGPRHPLQVAAHAAWKP